MDRTCYRLLSTAPPPTDTDAIKPGGNTKSTPLFDFSRDDWHPWDDFTYENLYPLYEDELQKRYGSEDRSASSVERVIASEKMLDFFLRDFVFHDVNRALNDQLGSPCIVPGDLCATRTSIPDWALIDRDQGTNKPMSFLPGETKLGKKWRANVGDEPWLTEDEWLKPIYQTTKYMIGSGTRYAYIITDIELVVLRLANGTNAGSSRGPVTRGQVARGAVLGGAPAEDPRPTIQWKSIFWSTNGQGQLTVKLALWFLAMMARNGDRKIEPSYPPLNTWRLTNGEFVHCLTGQKKKKLGDGDDVIE